MKKLFIFGAVALMAMPAAATAWEAVTVPATRKVVPTASMDFTTYGAATLEGCRNEWEAFQIIVKENGAVNNVNVVMSDLADGNGNVIPASAARLYREWFLNVVAPSGWGVEVENHLRRPGLYPDPLIPFVDPYSDGVVQVGAPFNLTTDDPGLAVVFVDIRIPADAVFGVYNGTATVSATDRADIVLPVRLTVWELDMPSERNVGTSFRMGDGSIRRYHGGTEEATTDADYDRIVRNYYNASHENRIDNTGIQGPVSFNFDEAGNLLPVDWTAYDEYMAPYLDGSYFNDGVGVARFDVGMFAPGRSHSGLTDDQYKLASAALANHLNEKGWWDEAWVYSKDEPWLKGFGETQEEVDADMAAVANDARMLIEGSDLWKGHVLVTGPSYEQAAPHVGIWCPVQPMYGKWYWTSLDYPGRGDYDEHLTNGGELWFYNCNGNEPPFAGYDIDTQIGYEPRILKWGSWWEGATGYLYWRELYWGDFDPWIEWQDIPGFGAPFARNGDGLLMYPGDSNGYMVDDDGNPITPGTPSWLHMDGPVVSYRMKQIRDGLEDWELFILADKAGIGEWVRNEMTKVYRRFGNFMELDCEVENYYCPDDEPWTLDENELLEVRSRIAAKLLFTLYPDRYPDPDTVVVAEDVEAAETTGDTGTADDLRPDADDVIQPVDATDDTGTSGGGGDGCSVGGGHAGLLQFLIIMFLTFAAMIWSGRCLKRPNRE